jgi:hypothetical protein
MTSRSIDIRHKHVLSAELRTLGNGDPYLEVWTDLPFDRDAPELNDMCDAVNEQRDNLPPWKRGRWVHYASRA